MGQPASEHPRRGGKCARSCYSLSLYRAPRQVCSARHCILTRSSHALLGIGCCAAPLPVTNGSLTPGVLVYFIDTSIPTGSGPLKVLPINDADATKNSAALLPGASVTLGSVTVTFVSQDASGDRVRVVR